MHCIAQAGMEGIELSTFFPLAKVKQVPKLYFQEPRQLLSIFTDLEDENLKLIQECREAEGNLEKIRTSVREVKVAKIG